MPTDDVLVEAALATHGASITRHDLAVSLEWNLARVERALRALDSRLAETGLCLRRSGWDSYILTVRPRVLEAGAARRLRLAHDARVPLPDWAAALLSEIISGNAIQGLEKDIIPEPYRSVGVEVLVQRGLITATAHGYRPSDEVILSLRLDPGQY
jgi:hypothetical protein